MQRTAMALRFMAPRIPVSVCKKLSNGRAIPSSTRRIPAAFGRLMLPIGEETLRYGQRSPPVMSLQDMAGRPNIESLREST